MAMSCHDLAVPGIKSLKPYQPGKPISELEREYGVSNIIKLASNENPLGPSPMAQKAISDSLADLALYPDGNGFGLKQALSARHEVAQDSITLGNGSNDVIVLLAEAFLQPGSEAVYSQYAFAAYPIAVQCTGATARVAACNSSSSPAPMGHDLDAMAELISARTRLVFIANPNNPTGTWLPSGALRRFLQAAPDHVIVVVDEAYWDYVEEPDYPDTTQWLADFPNLVVTRTFSKAFGLAGLRVGYSISSPEIADLLNRVRQPFNTSIPAQVAALAALSDHEHMSRSVKSNCDGLQQLSAGFKDLGIDYVPSVCNFILADMQRPVADIFEALLRAGIIVRPVGNYGLPNHLRISVGLPEENTRFLGALESIMAGLAPA